MSKRDEFNEEFRQLTNRCALFVMRDDEYKTIYVSFYDAMGLLQMDPGMVLVSVGDVVTEMEVSLSSGQTTRIPVVTRSTLLSIILSLPSPATREWQAKYQAAAQEKPDEEDGLLKMFTGL